MITKVLKVNEMKNLVDTIQQNSILLSDYTYYDLRLLREAYRYKFSEKIFYSIQFNLKISEFDCVFQYTENSIIQYICKWD